MFPNQSHLGTQEFNHHVLQDLRFPLAPIVVLVIALANPGFAHAADHYGMATSSSGIVLQQNNPTNPEFPSITAVALSSQFYPLIKMGNRRANEHVRCLYLVLLR